MFGVNRWLASHQNRPCELMWASAAGAEDVCTHTVDPTPTTPHSGPISLLRFAAVHTAKFHILPSWIFPDPGSRGSSLCRIVTHGFGCRGIPRAYASVADFHTTRQPGCQPSKVEFPVHMWKLVICNRNSSIRINPRQQVEAIPWR
jgi:hypothetical protein